MTSDNDNTNGGDQSGDASASSDSDKIRELMEHNEKLKNEYLYLRADFDNYKKSVIKERSDLIKYGSERVFNELLEVLDNFERALQIQITPENINTFKTGVDLIASELKKMLQRYGVQEVDCQGVAFDPTLHEALSSEETSEIPPGHVSRVFRKAYKLHDRVIRPAQVVVAKEPKDNNS